MTSVTTETTITSNVWHNSMANGIPVGKMTKGPKSKQGSTSVSNFVPPTSVAWGGMGLPRQLTPRPQGTVPCAITRTGNNNNTEKSSMKSSSVVKSTPVEPTVIPK